ncbi:MAG: type VI secretion system tip protein VgrG [Bacteroidota bacterium]
MAAPSPASIDDSTISYSIKINGTVLEDTIGIVSIITNYEINRIPWAEIVLIDGKVEDDSSFPNSSSETFLPGNAIVISAGYNSINQDIFTGLIVKQSVKINSSTSHLVISCKHKAVAMTFDKKEAISQDKKDSDIISGIIVNYSGLSATVEATTITHESMYQKLATDWDFILSRADFCGLIVYYTMENIMIKAPPTSSAAVLTVAFGTSIFSFDAELNAEKQPTAVSASSWDAATLAMISSSASEPVVNTQGNLVGDKLSKTLGQSGLKLNSGAPMSTDSLKKWADSSLLRMRLNAIKGRVSFQGSAKVMPGNIIVLEGVGDRFNGDAFVSSVTHTLENGEWVTAAKFGLDNKPVSELPNFSYSPAAGQLPSIHGLQVGVVKKLDADPLAEFRIQITLSANTEADVLIWARMSNFYATSTSGSFFLPEIGDEVVVGFLENNPAFPVILGSLYSKKNAAELTVDSNNYLKGITTKSKLKIAFDDDKKITKISTPGGNMITLDDDGKMVDITDQNSNSIKMTSSGIEIKSAKDITLKATGKIILDATAALSVTSKADVEVSGLNIKNTAQVGFAAKGNATAEISASGQTTVKGAIVMIN